MKRFVEWLNSRKSDVFGGFLVVVIIAILLAILLAIAEWETAQSDHVASWEPTAYPRVVTFCDHGNRVYVYLHEGGVAVVPGDPSCEEER